MTDEVPNDPPPVTYPFPWDNLIRIIESGKIIPVIGPDVHTHRGTLLYHALAAAISKPAFSEKYSADKHFFHKAACERLKPSEPNTSGISYGRLKDLVRDFFASQNPAPSVQLLQLARIRKFRIYISTTYDDLLPEALRQVGRNVKVMNYTPKEKGLEELGAYKNFLAADERNVIVFNVFGDLTNNTPSFTESDIIESISSMHADILSSNNRFFNILKDSDFLFVGCNYKNWLMRFSIRSISNTAFDPRLSEQKKFFSSLLSNDVDDLDLLSFLEEHSFKTDFPGMQIFYKKSIEDFARDFWTRISAKPWVIGEDEFARDVFVSFHGLDRAFATALNTLLKSKGVKTWFDADGDRIGDDVNETIRRGIRSSRMFLTIVTENYASKLGYVERELNWAVDLNFNREAGSQIKILTLCIGAIAKNRVPNGAKSSFWAEVPDNDLASESNMRIIDRLIETLKEE